MRFRQSRGKTPRFILPALLFLALSLRLYGLDWGHGALFHADERAIQMQADCIYRVMAEAPGYQDCVRETPRVVHGLQSLNLAVLLDPRRSPLNLHTFSWGTSLIFHLLVLVRAGCEFLGFPQPHWNTVLAGRAIMAIADVLAMFFLYLCGRRLYGRPVALLAATFQAFAVIHIQLSHVYRPEPLSNLCVLASFWCLLRLLDRRRLVDACLLGLWVGCAFATKASMLPLIVPVALAYYFCAQKTRPFRPSRGGQLALHAAATAVTTGIAFLFMTPYALIDLARFVTEVTRTVAVSHIAGTVPFTIQYIRTPPLLYEVWQVTVWGLGWPLGLVAWAGLLWTLIVAMRPGPSRRGDLLLLSWVLPNLLLVAAFQVKFLRYSFPIVPFLLLMGARLLWHVVEASRRASRRGWRRYLPQAAIGLIACVMATTVLYAAAFLRIYARPHPAIQASRWITTHIPKGAMLIADTHWDEGLPGLGDYTVRELAIYEPDSPNKMRLLAQQLSEGAYVYFYSNRTYGSIARVPERFPLSSRYYQLLFSGQLGYQWEQAFASYPRALGVTLVDDPFHRAGLPPPSPWMRTALAPGSLNLGYADNDVISNDHPLVLVLKNAERLSASQLYKWLMPPASAQQPAVSGGALMLTSDEQAIQQRGGTWSRIVRRESWTNRLPVAAWLLVIELLSLIALPLAWWLFAPLPDRGLVLAQPLGLFMVSYLTWLMATIQWRPVSRSSVLVSLMFLVLFSGLVLLMRGRQFFASFRTHWRLHVVGQALFLAAFLAFVLIRMANPDLWHPWRGGEKPMDFAYLNAALRSSAMPPYNPWFAGGTMNYYYWGQFVITVLIHLTGILPSVAYNLAIALLFAWTVTGAFSIVYSVTQGVGPPHVRPGLPWGSLMAGVAAGLFVAVLGNLDGIRQLAYGAWAHFVRRHPFPNFDFWQSAHVLPNQDSAAPSWLRFWLPEKLAHVTDVTWHITEFPFFSFLFADLHAHVIVIPFTLLAMGLTLSLCVGLRQGRTAWWLFGITSMLALVLGAIWTVNAWDYPCYLFLAIACAAVGVMLSARGPFEQWRLFLVVTLGLMLLSVLAFLPFHRRFEMAANGLTVSKWPTPIGGYVMIHGFFLWLTVTFLVSQARRRDPVRRPAALPRGAFWVCALVCAYLASAGYFTAALLFSLLALTILVAMKTFAQRTEQTPYALFPLLLLILALLLGLGVEFVRVNYDIGRMNTLFKYYLEAWVLFGLAAAYSAWALARMGVVSLQPTTRWVWTWRGVFALLAAASLVYPVLGTRARVADRFPAVSYRGLDGAAYLREAVHHESGKPISLAWDDAAIQWLQTHVEGSPVILEAQTEGYRWGGRISVYTGLPTVLGWPWHQTQQRPRNVSEIERRQADVRTLYSTPDPDVALALLRRYEVTYIIIGELERTLYPLEGLDKFERLEAQQHLAVVYQNPAVRIYQVIGADHA